MVAHLLRLKLLLLRNSLRRSTAQLVGMVLGGLYALFLVATGMAGLVALRFAADPQTARAVVVLAGGAVTLGWVIVPLVVSGVDQTLDPVRFSTYAVPRRDLVLGNLLAGVVGVPGAAAAVLALATVVTFSRSPGAVVLALVGAVVALLTCVALSRAVATAAAALLRSRRGKEVATVVGMLVVVSLGPAVSVTSEHAESFSAMVRVLVPVVSWTPLGLPWAVGGDASVGAWGTATVRLVLALGVLAAVLAAWSRALQRAAENPREGGGPGAVGSGLGWFARVPATPTGAVAARALTYWRRDPRYLAAVGLMPLLPLGLLVPNLVGQGRHPTLGLLMAPTIGYLLGYGLHNDLAYDGTAFWGHLATGVAGVADRVGRMVPTAVLGLVLVPLYAVIGCAVAGRAQALPAVLGCGLALLLGGFGLSSVVSALKPYPVPGPGENPFSSPTGASGLTLLVQVVTSAVLTLLVSPVLVLAALAVWGGRPGLAWVALGLGAGLGTAYLLVGVRVGARVFDRRGPQLLADLSRAR